jgi:predicted dehydrogenase
MPNRGFSRRYFFQGALLAGAVPAVGFGSAPSLKALGYKPYYDKLNIAAVGCGSQGAADSNDAARTENIVALCDVDEDRAAPVFKRFDKATKYKDFRVMLDKEGQRIDACIVAVPDFMHATVALAAMQRGKAVYVEKPLTRTPWEARLLGDAAVKYKVATQMGNQGFSHECTRVAAEMVWSGAIGDVTEAHISTTPGTHPTGLQQPPAESPVPRTLDWKGWLGRAQPRPFSDRYVPYNWRGFLDFGTGQIGNWATHAASPVQFALQLGAPTSVECTRQEGPSKITYPNRGIVRLEFPARGKMPAVTVYYHDSVNPSDAEAFHVPGMDHETILPPADNLTDKGRPTGRGASAAGRGAGAGGGRGGAPAAARSGKAGPPARPVARTSAGGPGIAVYGPELEPPKPGILAGNGAVLIGTKGILATRERGEGVWLLPAARWAEYTLPAPLLTRSPGHMADWVRACKGGEPSCSDFRITAPFAEWLALAVIAWRVPGKLQWDSRTMRFTNSAEATRFVKPEMPRGWELKL